MGLFPLRGDAEFNSGHARERRQVRILEGRLRRWSGGLHPLHHSRAARAVYTIRRQAIRLAHDVHLPASQGEAEDGNRRRKLIREGKVGVTSERPPAGMAMYTDTT